VEKKKKKKKKDYDDDDDKEVLSRVALKKIELGSFIVARTQ
jgi:hypothetical protein